jgi:hypothetical protein
MVKIMVSVSGKEIEVNNISEALGFIKTEDTSSP